MAMREVRDSYMQPNGTSYGPSFDSVSAARENIFISWKGDYVATWCIHYWKSIHWKVMWITTV